jgi:superfamily I DNA and RNA helicase
MKKVLSVFLIFILLVVFCGVALAKEKIVQLNVPSCSTWGGSKHRISSILKNIDGVKKHEIKEKDILIITFDDKKTTLKMVINELKKGHLTVKGKPIYLKSAKTS